MCFGKPCDERKVIVLAVGQPLDSSEPLRVCDELRAKIGYGLDYAPPKILPEARSRRALPRARFCRLRIAAARKILSSENLSRSSA